MEKKITALDQAVMMALSASLDSAELDVDLVKKEIKLKGLKGEELKIYIRKIRELYYEMLIKFDGGDAMPVLAYYDASPELLNPENHFLALRTFVKETNDIFTELRNYKPDELNYELLKSTGCYEDFKWFSSSIKFLRYFQFCDEMLQKANNETATNNTSNKRRNKTPSGYRRPVAIYYRMLQDLGIITKNPGKKELIEFAKKWSLTNNIQLGEISFYQTIKSGKGNETAFFKIDLKELKEKYPEDFELAINYLKANHDEEIYKQIKHLI